MDENEGRVLGAYGKEPHIRTISHTLCPLFSVVGQQYLLNELMSQV